MICPYFGTIVQFWAVSSYNKGFTRLLFLVGDQPELPRHIVSICTKFCVISSGKPYKIIVLTLSVSINKGMPPEKILQEFNIPWIIILCLIGFRLGFQKTYWYPKDKSYSPSSSVIRKCLTCLKLSQDPLALLCASYG